MNKIILDCDQMRYKNSGLYHYCLNLGIYVQQALDKKKDEISFYVPGRGTKEFGLNAKCVIEKQWHKKMWIRPFLWDCNIWHTPFQSGRMFPINNKRIRKLLTVHDINALHEPITESNKKGNLLHTQRLIDHADCIICISEHTKNDVMASMDIKNKPIHVIHNGTHIISTPPASPSGYLPQRPFLFTMGYINRKKNFHTLIPLLVNNTMELIIAGKLDDPDYISGIWDTAAKLGVADRLRIPGPVSEMDKAWYFKNCTAFLFPSLAEGFGAPVVEAMGFGKPLFLSDKTSLPEVGGDVAFYFKDFGAEHMRQVFNEGMESYKNGNMKERIILRGKQFSWEKSAQQYIDVYHSMMINK